MYSGKRVLITGTSRGVGESLAKHFVYNNAKVIGLCRDVEGYDCGEHFILCDLSDTESIVQAFGKVSKFGPVDICINNAAVLTSQYALKMDVEDASRMVQIDLLAPFIVAREAAKLIYSKSGDYGRIINISSMAVALEPMGDSMYAACKAGLNKMSNIMAKEFAGFGITVNTLAISAIETDMLKQLNREKVDKVVKSLPIPRYATMDDITNVIDFFCSPKSDYITAQTIYLGGVHA